RVATHSASLPRRPAISSPFPYTTLFRSARGIGHRQGYCLLFAVRASYGALLREGAYRLYSERPHRRTQQIRAAGRGGDAAPASRSEEHTSELQSRENLVCRLLLEKKKSH